MAPIVKDSEPSVFPTTPAGAAASGAKTAEVAPARPQPVALEIPVTVNGARTVGGSDKREPFSETTKTVLVFGQGAVIRLASAVAPGQLVFLTNEKTKKEVVCQIVKSKNYRTVTGYVELEFTEPATGFWGVRFPTDRPAPTSTVPAAPRPIAPAASAPPKLASIPSSVPPPAAPQIAPPAPAAVKPMTSSAPVARILAESKPVVAPPANVPAVNTTAPVPVARVVPASQVPSAVAPVIPLPKEIVPATIVAKQPAPETKIASPEATKTKTLPAAGPSSEEHKQQTARLQEQLGSLLFADSAAPKISAPVPAPPPAKLQAPVSEVAAKILEMPHADTKPPAPVEFKPLAHAPKPIPTSLAVEEVKIPSWLAPLSRDVQSANTEASHVSETPAELASTSTSLEFSEASDGDPVEDAPRRPQTAVFGGQLLGETSSETTSTSSGPKKGLLIGIAATLLLVAGGFWYSRQPGNFLSGLPASKSAPIPAAAPLSVASDPVSNPVPATLSPAGSSATPVMASPLTSKQPVFNTTPSANSPESIAASVPKNAAASSPNPPPAVEQPKKPVIADVHLAAPVVSRNGQPQAGSESELAVEANQVAENGEGLASLASAHRAEPTAPLPIGGDVKPAVLIKSVPPVYPQAAKTQHISGEVKIDALIDESGKVSTMKVLSGPTLLHQAALTALKQWKYTPAQLDGKPTAMHLTVAVQFRIQ